MSMTIRQQVRTLTTLATVIGGLFFAATPVSALDNTGFETPDKGDATTGWAYAQTGATWGFSAKAGLSGPNAPWKCASISPDPLGNQFAFLQYDASITQNMSGLVIGGTYDLNFFEAYRTEKLPGNDLSVILDEGLPTAVTLYSNSNVTNQTWILRRTARFVATKTSYILTFRSTNPLGGVDDRTTLIDGVLLTLVDPPPITYVKITNDADCDITTFKNYTHKLDFGLGTPGALINGVQFAAYNNAANGTLNFSRSASSGALTDHAGNTPATVSGNLANLMWDMYYNNANAAGGTTTWTLSGLTPGVTYDARIYVRQWGPSTSRLATFVFDPDGAGPVSNSTAVVSEDDARSVGMAENDAYYINYRFTAVTGENLVIKVTQHNANNSWHLYGMSCEQVQPTLKTMYPADEGTGMLVNADLVATFSANVLKGAGTMILRRSNDDSVVQTFDVNSAAVTINNAQVTLNPVSNLETNTSYYVEMDGGALIDHADRSCPAVTGKSTWNFTTLPDIITFVKITNDADCGILARKNYTHKLDFGRGIPGALINGVQFDAYNNATNGTLNFIRSASSGTLDDHAGGAPAGVSGALVNLMTDMYYNGTCAAGGTTTWTLSGLTPGADYITRIYVRQWSAGSRPVTLVFDPDGPGPLSHKVAQINEDDATSVGMATANTAYYINYPFRAVAGQNLVITLTQHTANGSWHLYGLTNERLPSAGTRISFQ
jgi:hypothetical protein